MRPLSTALAVFLFAFAVPAQDVRPKDVRQIAEGGSSAIPQLEQFLKNPNRDVRLETIKQITEINNQRGLDALIAAARDNDPEVQMRAAAGLVNFYYPGYVQSGLGGSLRRMGTSIKGRFTDVNDQAIDPFVIVRPEVIEALGRLVTGGGTMNVRGSAARGLGVLRGKAAAPQLIEAVGSKDSDVIYEALIALQKIRDQSAGPRVLMRLRDLDPKVQIAAIETVGLLQVREALPALADVLRRTGDSKVRRAALTAMAMMPDEANRSVYSHYLRDKDEKVRAAAAEGYARLRNPADVPALEQAWQAEGKNSPRLSIAFALAMLGRTEGAGFSPVQYLVDNLNSSAYSGEAYAFLAELARDSSLRKTLYASLATGTKDEKIGLARVMARSGDKDSVPELERLSRDGDPEVAQEGLRALRTIQARL